MANLNMKDMDVMQHIRNIYDILGATDNDGLVGYGSVVSGLTHLKNDNHQTIWVGSESQYEEDIGNGLITDDMICCINDDYIPSPN